MTASDPGSGPAAVGAAEPSPDGAVGAAEPSPDDAVGAAEPSPDDAVGAAEPSPDDAVGAAEPSPDVDPATRLQAERAERREKLARLRAGGIDPYPHAFPERTEIAAVLAAHDPAELGPGAHPGWRYRVAGRLSARREHGKATFADVADRSGTIQVYLQEELLGAAHYRRALEIDVGDVIGVEGTLHVTKRGQLAIAAEACETLAKALRTPPDKRHGVDDLETRYRHRALDLLANARTRETFARRAAMLHAVREWMVGHGFVEVESPLLVAVPGGAAARPFRTHHNALNRDLSLRISIELYLKRCLVGGLESVYELGRCFRNEGISHRHSPEFTMLEWMQSYVDYRDVTAFIAEMVADVAQRVLGTTTIERDGNAIDLAPPWRHVTVGELIAERFGVDIASRDPAPLAALMGDRAGDDLSWARLVVAVYGKLIEPELIEPTAVLDFPAELTPVAKRLAADPHLSESFDVVVGGLEIASGSTDVNDPDEQRARFLDQGAEPANDDPDGLYAFDEEYLEMLEYGMPPAAGAGLGIDRLAMLLTQHDSLREVVAFPAMREDRERVD